jgi:hypothetical protein
VQQIRQGTQRLKPYVFQLAKLAIKGGCPFQVGFGPECRVQIF